MKFLNSKEWETYQANLPKIEKISAMEKQLADATQTITDLTSATEQLNTSNTELETQVEELTGQVAALTAGSGGKTIKVKGKVEGGSGEKVDEAMSRAKSVLNALNGL